MDSSAAGTQGWQRRARGSAAHSQVGTHEPVAGHVLDDFLHGPSSLCLEERLGGRICLQPRGLELGVLERATDESDGDAVDEA